MATQTKTLRTGFSQSRYVLSLLRAIVGFTLSFHGAQKLFGMFGGTDGHGHSVPFLSLMWLAGFIEFFGGWLLVIGLFTRWVAFIACGEMAFAYFMRHAPRGLWPIMNGGELAVVYCFVFLYLFAAGPGPVSVDRLIRKREF
ncbi:MAG: DoxX family protein [Acidobacteriaceae bacterium]|nr:DoxX family protein [Acidobacteriaceae bacterium]MBV9781514.1 DoxX family protein [Acidobacteriaceae bacterium]